MHLSNSVDLATQSTKLRVCKLKIYLGGWLGGIVVKFARFASVVWGSQVWILGMDLALLIKPHCGGTPHKIEEDWHRCSLRANLPHKKEKEKKPQGEPSPSEVTGKR